LDIAALLRVLTQAPYYASAVMVALFVGGVWQIVASHFEMNVSATHSIIGAIIGFAFVYGGPDGVVWADQVPRVPGERRPFPPVKGVVPIVLSWFVSPVLTGLVSALIFNICRTLVLRRRNAFRMSFYVLPPLVMLTVWINLFFVFTKGAAKTLKQTGGWTDRKSGWISAVIAGGCTLIAAGIVAPLIWKRIHSLEERAAVAAADKSCEMEAQVPAADLSLVTPEEPAVALPPLKRSPIGRLVVRLFKLGSRSMHTMHKAAMHGMEVDIHAVVDEDPIVTAIHANAEVFDPRAEAVFSYLQVFSAVCVIFAHGAAEVGYMTGPLGAIWQVVNTGLLRKKVQSPLWVVIISAMALIIGLVRACFMDIAAHCAC
jgi:sodium-dependent phosphate transporter